MEISTGFAIEWPDGFLITLLFCRPLFIGADYKFLYYFCIYLSSITVVLSLNSGFLRLSPLELLSLLAIKVKQSGYLKDSELGLSQFLLSSTRPF
jgi:hypothetical protein